MRINFKEKVEEYETKISNLALRKAKEPIYITFNFSFITENSLYNLYCEDCSADHKHQLLERLLNLSSKDIVSLTAKTNKSWGLEKIDLKNFSHKDKISSLKLPGKFENSKRKELAGDKLWIFRLCPNNNPYPSRIIGKMIDNVFYIMYIDFNHNLYSRRN